MGPELLQVLRFGKFAIIALPGLDQKLAHEDVAHCSDWLGAHSPSR
jgi:hypothetical protein